MNKLIIAAVILIIAAVAILMLPPVSETVPEDSGSQDTGEQTTVDEEYVLQDMYIEILQEETGSVDLENFSAEIEDEMADDYSQFYYE